MDDETQKALLRYMRDQWASGYGEAIDVLDLIFEQLIEGKQYFTAGELIAITIGEEYYSD